MKSKKKGFTLIELVICILIFGVLLSIVLPKLVHGKYRALLTACQFNLRAVASALENFHTDHDTYPDTQQTFYDLADSGRYNPTYFHPVPTCPSSNERYTYEADDPITVGSTTSIHGYTTACNGGLHYKVLGDMVAQGYPQYNPATGGRFLP